MCDFVLLLLFIWRVCKDVANVIYFENTIDDKKKQQEEAHFIRSVWPHSIRCKIIMNNISFLLLLLPLPSAVAGTAVDAAVAFVWVVFSIFVCTVEKNGRAVCFCLPRLTKQKQIKQKNKA